MTSSYSVEEGWTVACDKEGCDQRIEAPPHFGWPAVRGRMTELRWMIRDTKNGPRYLCQNHSGRNYG